MLDDSMISRIINLRESKNWSQAELARRLGIEKSMMNKIENGSRKVQTDELTKLSSLFNVPVDFLLNGKEGYVNKFLSSFEIPISGATSESNTIPIYGRIVASNPEGAEEEIDGEIEIQSEVIEKYGEENLIALRVNGDSMNRVIPDGAIAILLKTDDVSQGDICGVIINGYEATLKHMYKTPNRILFEPDSYNPDYKAFEYTNDMDIEVKIIGKYLYAIIGR